MKRHRLTGPTRGRRPVLRNDLALETWTWRRPSLTEEFRGIGDALRLCGQRRLTRQQERYVLWARAEDIGVKPIARAVRKADWRIRRFIKEAYDDLGIFLGCRFVQKATTGHDNEHVYWLCRYCFDGYETAGPATRHAWRHVFDPLDGME